MRILLVADGRSPITRRWLEMLGETGAHVHLISSYPCPPPPGVEGFRVLPLALGGLMGGGKPVGSAGRSGWLVSRYRRSLLVARYWLGPLSIYLNRAMFRRLVQAVRPDVVHALRIPFEGMLAAAAPPEIPLVVSIWGNDLTLHAHGSRLMAALTRRCLRRADGLLADARRDLRLAPAWGLRAGRPTLTVPGSGGLPLEEVRRSREAAPLALDGLPVNAPLVINPRGFRPGSVLNEAFFKAIPRVLARRPEVIFLCPAMAGQAEALAWVSRLRIAAGVRLLPTLPQAELWALFHRSQVMVSPSRHDGTPNSLLEAMACGCFPVAGDIESLREWITDGQNGLLVDPGDEAALSAAILHALEDDGLRARAADMNARLVTERADRAVVRPRVEEFFQKLISHE